MFVTRIISILKIISFIFMIYDMDIWKTRKKKIVVNTDPEFK